MNLTVLPKRVLLGEHDLLKLRDSRRFLASFGKPPRSRDIPMHPSGTRIAMVWDELGLVAYEDRPELLMSHLHLAFDPKYTPERPSHASKSIVEINDEIVTPETVERTLPRNGLTPIVADSGFFFCETEDYSVHFNFQRRANPNGRYPATGPLVTVSFTWRPLSGAVP